MSCLRGNSQPHHRQGETIFHCKGPGKGSSHSIALKILEFITEIPVLGRLFNLDVVYRTQRLLETGEQLTKRSLCQDDAHSPCPTTKVGSIEEMAFHSDADTRGLLGAWQFFRLYFQRKETIHVTRAGSPALRRFCRFLVPCCPVGRDSTEIKTNGWFPHPVLTTVSSAE